MGQCLRHDATGETWEGDEGHGPEPGDLLEPLLLNHLGDGGRKHRLDVPVRSGTHLRRISRLVRTPGSFISLLATLLVLGSSSVQGQDEPETDDELSFGATAEVEEPTASTNRLDATAAGTEVPIRDESPLTTLADAAVEAPGTHVSRFGGFGAPASIALRGSDLGHTTVLLGDLALTGPEAARFDLGLWNPLLLDRIEVYRGGAPVWLDAGAIGGVLRLVPREAMGNAFAARLGVGSFGATRLQVASSLEGGPVRAFITAGGEGARNDYPFRYDNGTRFDDTDDEDRRRQNADSLGANALGNVQIAVGDHGRLQLLLLGSSRLGGEPGPGQIATDNVRRNDIRTLGSLGYVHELSGGHRVQLATRLGHRRHRFTDPDGRLGPSAEQTDDRFLTSWTRLGTTIRAAEMLDLSAIGTVGFERYEPHDAIGLTPPASTRRRFSGAVEGHLHGELGSWRFGLRPSIRLEHASTTIASFDPHLREQETQTDLTRPTYRVGALVAPVPAVAFVGSLSRGVRFPTTLELFGDRGVLLPSPELIPESGRHADGGVTLRINHGPLRAMVEARYFDLQIDDLIRYRLTSLQTARAENVESATVRGAEMGLRGHWGQYLEVVGTLTVLRAKDHRDLNLPWRPQLRAGARVAGHTRRVGPFDDLSLWVAWTHRGAYFHDPANLVEIEGRHWVELGVGAELWDGLSLGVSVRDLFDQRGQDFLGYPLPGRRVAALLQYRKELDR